MIVGKTKTKFFIFVPSRGNYVPPKPPSMRKVIRDKDNYKTGKYEITDSGLNLLQTNMSENGWYQIYTLPKEHIQSFKSRQALKYWAQLPPLVLFAKYATALNPSGSVATLAAFLFIRYYS